MALGQEEPCTEECVPKGCATRSMASQKNLNSGTRDKHKCSQSVPLVGDVMANAPEVIYENMRQSPPSTIYVWAKMAIRELQKEQVTMRQLDALLTISRASHG